MSFANEIEYYLYEEFLDLGPEAYQDKVRYFEANEKNIFNLPFERRIEIQLQYIEALHQTDRFHNVLNIIDDFISLVMSENIYEINGKDAYKTLLLIKSDCLYNAVDYVASKHVISELVRIEGDNPKNRKVFLKNNVDKLRYDSQTIKGISILLFIFSAFIIGIEIFVVRIFYTEWIDIFAFVRNSLFLLGVLTIIGREIKIKKDSQKEYEELIQ